ncbi:MULTISPECIES: helix-turn-helix transcriptional regulator [Nitrospirillum]|uniref:LuxR family transcriptional regulator n=1 Tax=Nitrospirillum amazonense TaxID=28077 RepID=A0A560FUA2_9PROT|nr:helix-turn-helix transcriptional regulator [Nitrospirillum amazonense]MEC4590059.1 helix-turn-helix transcriptional regulator [Nitrospirillum amazonense]TWB25060.1 LuxR family transcriptional regulator [Nitrospirillum amazonense]
MKAPDDITTLAGVVGAVGTPDFSTQFLVALGMLCGARLSSAFSFGGREPPRALFAAGDCRGVPDFARAASLAYARHHWRQDRAARLVVAAPRDSVVVIRTRAADIADPVYRNACYERGGIAERLSILSAGPRPLMANGYRTVSDGASRPGDVACVERFAPVLMAALTRHVDLSARPPGDGTLSDTAGILMAADVRLSAREAEVAAGLILGRTQEEISVQSGLSLGSVITYRRRAYCKLGVMDKRELVAAYRQLSALRLI